LHWKYCSPLALALTAVLLFNASSDLLLAQAAVPTAAELDQLLAPIALYPDALVAQITSASTNPQEILDVDTWLRQNPGLTGEALANAAQQQGFDPQFIALLNFPQVLDMMAQHVDDYAAIGAAFVANQGMVMDSIQRLRAQAYASGALRSTPQLQVVQQAQGSQQIIVIQSPNPQVVYIPQYDPAVIYAGPPAGGLVGGLITFGAGIAIGAILANSRPWGWGGWGWNWGRRSIIYNHNPWVFRNRYRPPRPFYRPRPIPYASRPGYNGHWGRPRPGVRPPGNRPGGGYQPRPGVRPPNVTRPVPLPRPQPGVRPAPIARPAPARPSGPTTRPSPVARPAPRPAVSRPTHNPYAGFPAASRPGAPPAARPSGGRSSAFGGVSSGRSENAARSRGRQSVNGAHKR